MLTYDEQFWNTVKNDDKYKTYRNDVAALYKEWCGGPIPSVPYSKFKLYFETGDRKVLEAVYFGRRRQLAASVMMYLIHGEDECLIRLQDIIWAICDEYTWSIPAHIHAKDTEGQVKTIDLFASETGYMLSEIVALIGDRLDELVVNRIKYEVQSRIIRRFMNIPDYWWEQSRSNWAAVCSCQVAGAYLYLAPELFPKIRARIDAAMDSFLSSFGNDGACLEGVSYWIYGFGFFVQYRELLSTIEPSALDIFKQEKIKNIAMFFQKSGLKGGISVTFADAQPQALYDIGLSHYLKKIYGGDFKLPPSKYALPFARLKFSTMIRAFMYYDPSENEKEMPLINCYLPDAQWFIRENDTYSFAAKGGHNNEPHNHNDIGSFLLCANGRQVLCDIGVGVYNRDYFSADTRYKFLGNGSHGHSVPIINGKGQLFGKEHKAKDVRQDGNTFSADILGAYDEKGSLVRTFEALESGINIIDTYKLENQPEAITERFVSYEKPLLEKGRIVWKDLTLTYDPDILSAQISEDRYENNFMGNVGIYLIDLKAILPLREMKIKIQLAIG